MVGDGIKLLAYITTQRELELYDNVTFDINDKLIDLEDG